LSIRQSQYFPIILVFLIIWTFVTVEVMLMWHYAHSFEMTPQLKIETTQLEMCIMYNINSTGCDKIYGGIPK